MKKRDFQNENELGVSGGRVTRSSADDVLANCLRESQVTR